MDKKWGIGVECEFPVLLDVTDYYSLNINQKWDKQRTVYMPFKCATYYKLTDNVSNIMDKIKNMLEQTVNKEKTSKAPNVIKALDDIDQQYILEELKEKLSAIETYQTALSTSKNSVDDFIKFRKKHYDSYKNMYDEDHEFKIVETRELFTPNRLINKFLMSLSEQLTKFINGYAKQVNEFKKCNPEGIIDEESTNLFKIYEVKNLAFKEKINTVKNEVSTHRETFMRCIKEAVGDNVFGSMYFYGEFGYYPFLYNYKDDSIKDDYLGSYHLNITLPYEPNIPMSQFEKMHINLMGAIQLLEPLFLGVFTDVKYGSFNDDHKVEENSFRLLNTRYFNILSYQNLITFFGDEKNPPTKLKHQNINPLVRKIFSNLGLNFYADELGIDFSFSPEYHSKDTKSYFGFEFRVLGLFKLDYVPMILRFIFMLAEYLENENISVPENPLLTVFQDSGKIDKYAGQITEIFREGWNSKIDDVYYNDLISIFKLNLDKETLKKENLYNNIDCYNLLNGINIYLKEKCLSYHKVGKSKFLQVVDDIQNIQNLGNLPNINRESYNFFLKIQEPDIGDIILKQVGISEELLDRRNFDKFRELSKSKYSEEDIGDLYWFLIDSRSKQRQTGGQYFSYKDQYIKYKQKYLSLKN
jgi:hypothetical protein